VFLIAVMVWAYAMHGSLLLPILLLGVALGILGLAWIRAIVSLHEQEALHRTLLEILPVNILLFDREKIRYANLRAIQTYGGNSEELVGQPLKRFGTPGAPLDQEAYLQVLEGKEVPLVEDRTTNLAGKVVDIEVSMHPVVIKGKTLGLIVSRDIHERKKAEEIVRANEARFKALAQNSLDMTLILNHEGQIIYASPNARRVPKDETGNPVGDIFSFLSGEDAPQGQELFRHSLTHPREIIHTEINAPLENGEACWYEIWLQNLLDEPAVGGIVLNLRDVSERKAYQSTIEHLAYHDALTGLPNRRMLREQAEQVLAQTHRNQAEATLIYLDLDRFKEVNDTLGHEAGDALLVQVAYRIQNCVRGGDILARLGGDEFAILLNNTTVEGAADAAHRVLSVLQQPFSIADTNLRIGASLGLGIFPRDGKTLEDLMRVADVAMYRAKESRSGFMFYSSELDYYSRERLQLVQDLRDSLEAGDIYLEYQPILDIHSGWWGRVEALARWKHPTRGILPAGMFVPLAEETGLVRDLDRKVLELACREASSLGLPVSVNISAHTLYDAGFPEMVRAALDKGTLEAGNLHLEITETAMIQDLPRAVKHLEALRQYGVKIALDDFGIGHASLAYLKNLPVDVIKIDGSFITGIGQNTREEAILRSIISLGRGLDIHTLAEGVETQEQMHWLSEQGCDFLQGYAIARPQPKEHLVSVELVQGSPVTVEH